MNYAPTWQQWETLLKAKVRLSTGRASELMQLADGRKSLEEIREGKAQSVARLRAQTSSLQSQCSEENKVAPSTPFDDDLPIERSTPPQAIAQDGHAQALALIDALVASSSSTRSTAADLLVSGSRQTAFEKATVAVADLYSTLSRAGR